MYNIELCAYNVLGNKLPNVVLSINDDGNVKFASHFESHYMALDFETPEQAVKRLNEFLGSQNIKLCEINCDKYILIREIYPMFYKTGYKLRYSK